ncbi:MAG: HD domain-containing protein [Gemmatimonadota bacterium]
MHPLLARAAEGNLPSWACVGEARRAHIERVASLLGQWARARQLPEGEVRRWRAAGWLHDVVKDRAPADLLSWAPAHLRDLPGALLHGPAAASRLAEEGVRDESFLLAIGYHTVGHPELDRMGRALYAADYLEPGRSYEGPDSVALRVRMEEGDEGALREVISRRITRLLERRQPMRVETLEFWNALLPSEEAAGDRTRATEEGRNGTS